MRAPIARFLAPFVGVLARAGVSPDIVAITQGTIVLTVVISYEIVRRYGVRMEQQAVAKALVPERREPEEAPA